MKCLMPGCNNDVEMAKNGNWKKHCSFKCRGQHNSIVGSEKRKATCLEKFGTTTNLKTKETRTKIKQTLMEKYGVSHQMHIAEVKNKIKDTCTQRYGVDNPSKSEEVKQKKINTSLSHFGVSHPQQSVEVQDKRREKSLEVYGVDHYSKTNEYREKFTSTCIEKYGVDNPSKVEHVKLAIRTTWKEKYGRNIHPTQRHLSQETIDKLNNVQWLEENKHQSSTYLSELLGVTYYTVLYAYDKHKISRDFKHSAGEANLYDFIKDNYNGEIIQNSRKVIPPKELDIYLPDLKLAIEFNGIFWHSELQGKDKNYHLDKTRACAKLGIRLIHIFEDEWMYKQEIVKSRILNFFGESKKIQARKCSVIQIPYAESKNFLEENHIQGYATSSVQYALEYNSEIVSLMTFGKSRYNKDHQWELIRFANKRGFTVVGGASRLFACFIKEHAPDSIVSYSDKRWNTGGLYERLGFSKIRDSGPNYWYTNDYQHIESRIKYQRHKLKDLLQNFDSTKSEWENMTAAGFDRIWDCGNSVFSLVCRKET